MGMYDSLLPPFLHDPLTSPGQPDPAFAPGSPSYGATTDFRAPPPARGITPSLEDALRFLHTGAPWLGMAPLPGSLSHAPNQAGVLSMDWRGWVPLGPLPPPDPQMALRLISADAALRNLMRRSPAAAPRTRRDDVQIDPLPDPKGNIPGTNIPDEGRPEDATGTGLEWRPDPNVEPGIGAVFPDLDIDRWMRVINPQRPIRRFDPSLRRLR
jgi:hypothetical protein